MDKIFIRSICVFIFIVKIMNPYHVHASIKSVDIEEINGFHDLWLASPEADKPIIISKSWKDSYQVKRLGISRNTSKKAIKMRELFSEEELRLFIQKSDFFSILITESGKSSGQNHLHQLTPSGLVLGHTNVELLCLKCIPPFPRMRRLGVIHFFPEEGKPKRYYIDSNLNQPEFNILPEDPPVLTYYDSRQNGLVLARFEGGEYRRYPLKVYGVRQVGPDHDITIYKGKLYIAAFYSQNPYNEGLRLIKVDHRAEHPVVEKHWPIDINMDKRIGLEPFIDIEYGEIVFGHRDEYGKRSIVYENLESILAKNNTDKYFLEPWQKKPKYFFFSSDIELGYSSFSLDGEVSGQSDFQEYDIESDWTRSISAALNWRDYSLGASVMESEIEERVDKRNDGKNKQLISWFVGVDDFIFPGTKIELSQMQTRLAGEHIDKSDDSLTPFDNKYTKTDIRFYGPYESGMYLNLSQTKTQFPMRIRNECGFLCSDEDYVTVVKPEINGIGFGYSQLRYLRQRRHYYNGLYIEGEYTFLNAKLNPERQPAGVDNFRTKGNRWLLEAGWRWFYRFESLRYAALTASLGVRRYNQKLIAEEETGKDQNGNEYSLDSGFELEADEYFFSVGMSY